MATTEYCLRPNLEKSSTYRLLTDLTTETRGKGLQSVEIAFILNGHSTEDGNGSNGFGSELRFRYNPEIKDLRWIQHFHDSDERKTLFSSRGKSPRTIIETGKNSYTKSIFSRDYETDPNLVVYQADSPIGLEDELLDKLGSGFLRWLENDYRLNGGEFTFSRNQTPVPIRLILESDLKRMRMIIDDRTPKEDAEFYINWLQELVTRHSQPSGDP